MNQDYSDRHKKVSVNRTSFPGVPSPTIARRPENCPKMEVKPIESLFLLSYSDVTSETLHNINHVHDFDVFLYIDIPTIDYYNDELKHNKLAFQNQ